jgi:hypothetical protein
MSGQRTAALADELRIIRAARRNGRGRVHPSLLRNAVTDAREAYLLAALGIEA